MQINAALDSVGLKDQKNTISKKLSGGQKRKLSVAIAVLGDPKVCRKNFNYLIVNKFRTPCSL